jgi:hypothetical protein
MSCTVYVPDDFDKLWIILSETGQCRVNMYFSCQKLFYLMLEFAKFSKNCRNYSVLLNDLELRRSQWKNSGGWTHPAIGALSHLARSWAVPCSCSNEKNFQQAKKKTLVSLTNAGMKLAVLCELFVKASFVLSSSLGWRCQCKQSRLAEMFAIPLLLLTDISLGQGWI